MINRNARDNFLAGLRLLKAYRLEFGNTPRYHIECEMRRSDTKRKFLTLRDQLQFLRVNAEVVPNIFLTVQS